VQTDITELHNEPGTCLLRDDVNSGDKNVIKKEVKSIFKYENITTGKGRMWNSNTNDTSNNRGTGTISKSSKKYQNNVPGKHDVTELQKTAILGTYFRKY
jgi:hypothetical protein